MLNDLLTHELTAVNQLYVHYKTSENWGFERLAHKLKELAFGEMHDADKIIERILYYEGVPNLQRLSPLMVGDNIPEQLQLSLDREKTAVKMLSDGITLCVEERDEGTRVMLEEMLSEEEEHLNWLEMQLELIRRLGEANYLAQQVRE